MDLASSDSRTEMAHPGNEDAVDVLHNASISVFSELPVCVSSFECVNTLQTRRDVKARPGYEKLTDLPTPSSPTTRIRIEA